MVIVDKKFTPGKDLRLLRGVQMVIVEKKFTSGKDLRLLHGGPGGVPRGSRGGYTPVPGGVVDELRLLHPHLRPISMHLKNASMDMLAINGHSLFENEHFRVISGILAV